MAKLSRTRRRPCTRLVGGILLILGLFTLFIFELSWQSSTTSNRVHTVRGHSLDMHNEERQYGPLPNAAPLQLSTDAISRTLNSTTSLSMLMQKAETSRPAAPYISRGISVSPDNIWLYGGFAPDRQLNRTRLLVVSIGGVGTTSLMDTLKNALSPHGVDVNDVNNQDGLKHTSYSELSRGAIAAFAPSVVIYVLGNPAAAIASHFRRGWPGSQLCLVNPAAESIIGGNSELNATMDPPPKTNFMTNYSLIVSDSGVDYFASFEHASSWLGATELGLTVFFASLQTLISSQEAVSRLLNIKPASSSLFEFQVRNSSWSPAGRPAAYLALYEAINAHLMTSFNGACVSSLPETCSNAGLRTLPGPPINPSLSKKFHGARSPVLKIVGARRLYIRRLPGVCGALLRPKPRVFNATASRLKREAMLRAMELASTPQVSRANASAP